MYLMEIVAVILLGLLIGSLITAAVHTGADAVSFARKILLPYAEQQISSNLKHIEL
jgi:ABC-type spermidine/putrescine transport system permease subunit II